MIPPGLASLGIFWSMIETGVAVPVACLPTLCSMFRGFSPESVINSLRSRISIASLSSLQIKESRGSYEQKSKSGSFELGPRLPLANKTGFVGPGNRDGDVVVTHVQGDVEHGHHVGRVPMSEIQVDRRITQSVEQV